MNNLNLNYKTMKTLSLLLVLMNFYFITLSQTYNPDNYKLADVCLSDEEWKLYDLINEYRRQKGLADITISRSLTYVAQLHVWDLNVNKPDAKSKCNMHSWSNKGTWSACCYTSDHAKASCMWDKPKELTNYKGNGFEIAHGTYGYSANAESALSGWKGSSGHNNVMINKSIWKDMNWNAIGIGISGGFAVVWFGTAKDMETVPVACED